VSVTIFLEDDPEASTTGSGDYQTYARGASLVPLIMVLVLAMTTNMVELSLFLGIWLGACILTGGLSSGFKTTLDEFLVGALANEGHVFVILFTVFLSGAVGMMVRDSIANKKGLALEFVILVVLFSFHLLLRKRLREEKSHEEKTIASLSSVARFLLFSLNRSDCCCCCCCYCCCCSL
jgi:hypothetical protein